MANGPTGGHADSGAPKNALEDGAYRTPIEHAPLQQKDGYESDVQKYGAGAQRGFDIHISSPVADVEELRQRTHLTTQFHEENRDYWEESSGFQNDGGMLYDLAILILFGGKLNCEDIDPSNLNTDIPVPRLKALFCRKHPSRTARISMSI